MEKCADYDVGRVPGWVKNCWLKMKLLVFGLAFLGLTTVSAKTLSGADHGVGENAITGNLQREGGGKDLG